MPMMPCQERGRLLVCFLWRSHFVMWIRHSSSCEHCCSLPASSPSSELSWAVGFWRHGCYNLWLNWCERHAPLWLLPIMEDVLATSTNESAHQVDTMRWLRSLRPSTRCSRL